MRYAAALVLLVFTIGCAGAGTDSLTECLDAFERDDYDAAVPPCTTAGKQGAALAQYNLGFMYDNGYGVPEDDAKAAEWYTEAAEQGNARAQYNLGLAYATSSGVPKNHIRAFVWLDLATTQGHKDAARARDTVRKRMIPEQIAEAERVTSEWSEKFKAKQDGD